eukprot:scaffold185528_cov51-Attheya_sp.AAC.2
MQEARVYDRSFNDDYDTTTPERDTYITRTRRGRTFYARSYETLPEWDMQEAHVYAINRSFDDTTATAPERDTYTMRGPSPLCTYFIDRDKHFMQEGMNYHE